MTKVRAVVRRRWPLVAATTVLGLLAGIASGLLASGDDVERFEVEQVLVANTTGTEPVNVPQDALRITRGEVVDIAADALGQPGRRDELARLVEVTPEPDSGSIVVKVVDDDPEFASSVVQAFSNAFLQVINSELRGDDARRRDQLAERVEVAAREVEAFDQQFPFISRTDVPPPQTPNIDALVAERRRLTDAQSAAEQALQDFELSLSQREPYTTLGPENPRPVASLVAVPSSTPVRAVLLGGVGLLLGAALVVLVERLNRRIDTREELASLVKVPIIAEIGQLAEDKLPKDDRGCLTLEGVWSEQYRRVRSAIQFVQADADGGPDGGPTSAQQPGAVISRHARGRVPQVFMFVSALPGEGKSTSTVLTAMALAETGAETLIVNADFRRPTVERYLGARSSPSLADLAELRPDRPAVDDVVQHTGIDYLWLAAAGPPTIEVEGRLNAAREFATEAARRGGTVLIDSSPLRATNDAIDLLPIVDEVILVVRAGQSTSKSLEETLALLDMHHAPVLGVVLVGTSSGSDMYRYYGAYVDEAVEADRGRRRRGTPVRGARPAARPAPRPAPTPHGPFTPGANGHDPVGAPSCAPRPGAHAQPPPVGSYAKPRPPADAGHAPSPGLNGHDHPGASGHPAPEPRDAPPFATRPAAPPPYRGPGANPFAPRGR